MATLQIAVQDITAGPYHPVNGPCVFTTNSNRVHVTPPGGLGNLSIWQVANPAQPDPVVTTDGSFFPVTIRLPAAYSNQWRLPLTVTILLSGTVPPTWKGNRGVVYGNLMDSNGNLTPVLEGDPFTITNQPGGPPMDVHLSGFRFVTALRYLNPNTDNYQFAIPFRASGDWVWTIRDAMDANSVAIPAVMPTRMELSFVAWPAKNGAGNGNGVIYPPGPLVQSFTDFQGCYPVPVQRWSYPNMLELAQNLNVTRDQLRILYVRRLVNYVWSYGEAGSGRFQSRYITDGSGHSMGPFGGVFALSKWIRPPANHYVNDYDLAAVIQLGCAVALGITGNEIFESRWVVQYPSGYIQPGQLFGEGQTSQQCNNPFWNTGNPSWNANPNVANPYDVTRTGFIAHTWIEVRLDFGQGEDSYVLDATHGLLGPPGLPPAPENGSRTRPAYLAAHKDDNYAANGANFILPVRHLGRVKGNALDWDVGQQNGDCYMSPEVRLARVGVFGTNFDFPNYMLPPIWGSGNPLIDAYFPYLGPQFDTAPTNTLAVPERYNNASLSAKTILSLGCESWPHHSAHLVHHDMRPSLDRTSVEMIFALRHHDEDQEDEAAQFSLNLTVYSSTSVARDSTESLMELLGRTISTKSKSPTAHQLGDLPCLQSSQGGNGMVYFVRGNVAASFRSDDNFTPPENRDTIKELVFGLANRLDKHISSALVDDEVDVRRGGVGPVRAVVDKEEGSNGKPVSPLATYVTVRKGGVFTLLVEPFDAVDDCHAWAQKEGIPNGRDKGLIKNGVATEDNPEVDIVVNVSDPTAVVCTEQRRQERGNGQKLVFAAYKAGTVAITLFRPHVETLMPGFRRVIVEVVDEV
ncbi:hypothetical protein QBC37DRAFT_404545 [Rhypophila decipiens]|uniref:Uncharacterized protein n=1 Tax=Rhypophila decipiens TaxID=261697 RepID=A0AAN6XYY9_9PEZI|nr:hypothetical protein QBC37DRAFT_404545 [Rhypophila decipiens]